MVDMARREWIGRVGGLIAVVTASASAAGCAGYDLLRYMERREIRKLQGLGKFVYYAQTHNNKGTPYESKHQGGGIVWEKGTNLFYFTKNHIVQARRITGTPSKVSIRGVVLEEVVRDQNYDVAIFKLPKHSKLGDVKPFPLPEGSVVLGERVGLIGNYSLHEKKDYKKRAYLTGRVFDIDGRGNIPKSKGQFGMQMQVIPGDSGHPVVSIDDWKLVGMADSMLGGHSFATRIKHYTRQI